MKSFCLMSLAAVWLSLVGSAFAQDAAGASEGARQADRAQTFQAVQGPVKEDIPGGPLVVGAYAVIWLAIFGYMLRLVSLQRRTLEEIEGLRRVVEAAGGSATDGEAAEA